MTPSRKTYSKQTFSNKAICQIHIPLFFTRWSLIAAHYNWNIGLREHPRDRQGWHALALRKYTAALIRKRACLNLINYAHGAFNKKWLECYQTYMNECTKVLNKCCRFDTSSMTQSEDERPWTKNKMNDEYFKFCMLAFYKTRISGALRILHTYSAAYGDEQLPDCLGVIHQDGFNGAVQHFDLLWPLLLLVLQDILREQEGKLQQWWPQTSWSCKKYSGPSQWINTSGLRHIMRWKVKSTSLHHKLLYMT